MINNENLVSVIIPCYNCEKYVEMAIRSIMEQTYKNLEIIVTNDCSKDSTLSILEKLAKEDTRIVVLNNEVNLKITKTLNKMVDYAHGKYIARMDADDISINSRIEKQVLFMENNQDISICGTDAFNIDETGKIIGKEHLPESDEQIKAVLQYRSPFYHPSVMIKAEVLKNNKYSEDYPYAEDYELWVRYAYRLNLKMANIHEKLLKYRVFKEQTCSTCHNEQNNSFSKVITNYKVISDSDMPFYNNVFSLHSAGSLEEMNYINRIYKEFKKQPFYVSFFAYKKIFCHLRKSYPKKQVIKFCCKLNMIRIIIYIIKTKLF